jgi:hypothetical protein
MFYFMLFVFIYVSRYPTRLPYQMMFVSFNSTMTGPTGGTKTTYPSTVETTKQRLGDLRHHLKRRGYNDKVIESGFSKASEKDILIFDTSCVNFIDGWILLACSKNASSSSCQRHL